MDIPITISLLTEEKFSCFMADTKFKSIKQYSRTPMLIIISNEYLPIGLAIFSIGISLSNTRLLEHLINLAQKYSISEKMIENVPIFTEESNEIKNFIINLRPTNTVLLTSFVLTTNPSLIYKE